jgi:purine-nucleoside phosphorylase
MPDPFAQAAASAARIAELTGVDHHDVAIVFGSGWTPAADVLGRTEAELPFQTVGGFPEATVAGHAGVIRSIDTGARRVLAIMGRVHLYEGHEPSSVVHGVRTAVAAGARIVVLTNAAGCLRPGMSVGDPVLIADHINFTGRSPLTGVQPPEPYATRFVDLTEAYSARLRRLMTGIDPSLTEGVYFGFGGPQYETPAEIEMVRRLGGHLVGMSTVLETIAARHMGAEVLGLSLVTNLAAGMSAQHLDHREVLEVAAASAARMGGLLAQLVAQA